MSKPEITSEGMDKFLNSKTKEELDQMDEDLKTLGEEVDFGNGVSVILTCDGVNTHPN